MCKTLFDSQGMILNGFEKKHFLKKETPPFMANAIKNFHIFLNPSPRHTVKDTYQGAAIFIFVIVC